MKLLLRKITLWIKAFRYKKCNTCTNYYNPRTFKKCPVCDAQQKFDELRNQALKNREGEFTYDRTPPIDYDRSYRKRREEEEPKRSSNEGWFQASTGNEWYGSGNISDLSSSSSDNSSSTGYGSSSDSSSSDSGGGGDFGGGGSSDSF